LYKDMYGSLELYEQFKEGVETLAARNKNFVAYTYEVLNEICDKIRSVPAFKNLDDVNFPVGELPDNCFIYSFSDKIWPKFFISVDIRQANFTALKYVDKDLVLGCETWNELLQKFTQIKFFYSAKYFRQACLGTLKNKRFGMIQLHILSQMYVRIKDVVQVFGRAGNDEIIVRTTKETMREDFLKIMNAGEGLPGFAATWKVEPFSIEPLGKSSAFIKKCYDGKSENIVKEVIMSVEKDFHAQAFKYYTKQQLNENDMKAMKDNYLITYEDKYEI